MFEPKDILGYPAYRLYPDGKLESRWEWGHFYPGIIKPDTWRELPLKYSKNDGYIPVCLCGNGPKKRTHLHRLLAEVFISPPPFKKACVRHLDGNPINNDLSNLAWGTYMDNENDKRLHGTYAGRASNVKLDSNSRKEVRSMRKQGIPMVVIAQKMNVSRPTISRLLAGATWK